MNEKNPDVDRVLAVLGGAAFPYLSLGPVVLHPRIAVENMPFIYNEIGEPEYVPQRMPLSAASMEAGSPSSPASPIEAPPKRMAPPSLAVPTTPRSGPTAQAEPSAAIPFFPLLAAAMPNVTEPSYEPVYTEAPPPEAEIAVQPIAVDESLALFPIAPMTPDPMPPMPSATTVVMSAAEASDRLSLAEMFAALGQRQSKLAAVEPPKTQVSPNKAILPKSSGTEAMFRRI